MFVQCGIFLRVNRRRIEAGFTLVELIVVMVIIGVLAVFAAPRFFDLQIFRSRGFSDQLHAAVRYAQKAAIAQRRNVCVTVSGANVALTIAPLAGDAQPCTAQLADPSTLQASFVLNVPADMTINAAPASFYFSSLGRPFDLAQIANPNRVSQAISITVAGRNITVENETGYVHR